LHNEINNFSSITFIVLLISKDYLKTEAAKSNNARLGLLSSYLSLSFEDNLAL
jgi:hypothetical protein